MAAGEELSGSLHAELAFVEASLRDRIRAPQLNHPELVSTIGTLRRHGVEVVVLGEPALPGEQVSDGLATALAEAIAPVRSGRVIIRTLPTGRAAAASLVTADDTGSARLEFSATGTVLAGA